MTFNTLTAQLNASPSDTIFAVWAGFEAQTKEQLGGKEGKKIMIAAILARVAAADHGPTHARLMNNGFSLPAYGLVK